MQNRITLRFSNTSPGDVRVVLEPWATAVVLGAGATVDVISSGAEGVIEVEYGFDRVVFYGWPGAVLHLASHGAVLESGTGFAGPGSSG